jgi:hypothetical protein
MKIFTRIRDLFEKSARVHSP